MSLDGQGQLVRGNALAIIRDANEITPTSGDLDVDPPGTRIEGVLKNFLDDTRRSLDDFAGGDLIHDCGCKASNGHGWNPRRERPGHVFRGVFRHDSHHFIEPPRRFEPKNLL